MEEKDFEVDYTRGNDKKIYKHIENGKKREELVSMAMEGVISGEEMRTRAKKLKYLFSEKEYFEIIN